VTIIGGAFLFLAVFPFVAIRYGLLYFGHPLLFRRVVGGATAGGGAGQLGIASASCCDLDLDPSPDSCKHRRYLRFSHLDNARHCQPAHADLMVRIAVCFELVVEVLNHIRKAFSEVDPVRPDVDRLDVLGTVLPLADACDVDRPAMRDIAERVGHLANADMFTVHPVDHHLQAAWVDVHDCCVIR